MRKLFFTLMVLAATSAAQAAADPVSTVSLSVYDRTQAYSLDNGHAEMLADGYANPHCLIALGFDTSEYSLDRGAHARDICHLLHH